VYVTVFNLEKSVIFDKYLGLKDTDSLRVMHTHIVDITDEWELERFQTVKVTFKVTQSHRYWWRSIGHM